VNFHRAYDGNILVKRQTVGIAATTRSSIRPQRRRQRHRLCRQQDGPATAFRARHGVADFDEDSEDKRPTVQVGDPFTEKLLIEACLELMASDAIVAIQDMGAAGLTSSSVEMASKGGVGIELDMNAVPCREQGMTPYEMMLSESQERMLMVLKPGREPEAEAIFRKVGARLRGDRHRHRHRPHGPDLRWRAVCDIPLGPLADEAPALRPPPCAHPAARARSPTCPPAPTSRRPAEADGIARPRQPPLDLGAV
jgi:phosphoribosylformylglycinamidine synthase